MDGFRATGSNSATGAVNDGSMAFACDRATELRQRLATMDHRLTEQVDRLNGVPPPHPISGRENFTGSTAGPERLPRAALRRSSRSAEPDRKDRGADQQAGGCALLRNPERRQEGAPDRWAGGALFICASTGLRRRPEAVGLLAFFPVPPPVVTEDGPQSHGDQVDQHQRHEEARALSIRLAHWQV